MNKNELVVVGIGSSAGGLEALQVMLSRLNDTQNCAYIIAQHLSPTHKSMMVELLSRVTNIPVVEIQNGMVIKQKTIYMTPENTDVYVATGKIYLKSIEQTYGPKPSVNFFFNSLAQAYANRAIGIILSGTGSDGAFGIRAIKASGGITIAQSPSTAKYDGMPVSAINTGKVDLVVPIDNISNEISRIISNLGKSVGDSINEGMASQIYRIIFDEKGVDFSQYKKNTLVRRIERRLAAIKIDTLNDYVDYLKSNSEEVTALYHDILIGVTEFFRDQDVFEAIQKNLESLLSRKEQGEEIRFWTIGCSTGEEAYSLAILLCEILKDKINKYKIKIFATDIDDEALKIARSGIYAETSLVNIKKEYIQRYFTVLKNQFEVKKSIRELVIFSKHNVISDSPFLRLDLISCRNMLIYFNQSLQNRFFPIVHYALKDDGMLVLGKSESLGQSYDLFIPVEKQEKIFKAQYTGIKEPPKLYNYATTFKSYDEPKHISMKNDEEILEEKIVEATQAFMLNQCVLVNSSNEIVYIKGEIAYLTHAQGKATNNIFKCVKEEFVLDLRSAINDVQKTRKMKVTQFRAVKILEGVIRYARVIIIPIKNDKNEDWFYALFFQNEEFENIKGHMADANSESETVEHLRSELTRTKSHLQNVIEELETSYEEMQSLNEELSSSNEELQSSNEELETTNEELQSTNEELQTAYSELKVFYEDKDLKAKQLEELTDKLKLQTEDLRKQKELTEAIINTTPVAITMVDSDGKLNFVNINAQKLFGYTKKELLNRNYNSTKWKITTVEGTEFNSENLPFNIIKKTFEPVYNVRHSIENHEGYRLNLSVSGAPLFDVKGEFMGAVFSIIDITSEYNLKQELTQLRDSKDKDITQQLTNGFEKLKGINISESIANQFNIVQMAMLDISTNIKNNLGELSLLNQTLSSEGIDKEAKKELSNAIENMITDMNRIVNSNITFYSELYLSSQADFTKIVKKIIELLNYSFYENQISVIDELDINTEVLCNPKEATEFLLELISFLNNFKHLNASDSTVIMKVYYSDIDDTKAIIFEFVDVKFEEKNMQQFGFEFCQDHFEKLFGTHLQSVVVKDGFDIVLELPKEGK